MLRASLDLIYGELPQMADTTSLEKQSLEAHVDLCALRYSQLDLRMTNIEKKVESIHEDIVNGQKSMTKVIVGTAGTVVAGVLSIIVTMIMRGV